MFKLLNHEPRHRANRQLGRTGAPHVQNNSNARVVLAPDPRATEANAPRSVSQRSWASMRPMQSTCELHAQQVRREMRKLLFLHRPHVCQDPHAFRARTWQQRSCKPTTSLRLVQLNRTRSCEGAWEELHDTCGVKYTGGCHRNFGRTSDAICQCSVSWHDSLHCLYNDIVRQQ